MMYNTNDNKRLWSMIPLYVYCKQMVIDLIDDIGDSTQECMEIGTSTLISN